MDLNMKIMSICLKEYKDHSNIEVEISFFKEDAKVLIIKDKNDTFDYIKLIFVQQKLS